MSVYLKIKSKHLGLEAKVIRHEERKVKKQIRWQADRGTVDCNLEYSLNSLHSHRVWDVRNENRATFLARAYLEDRPYNTVERKRKCDSVFFFYIVPRIVSMVNKYGRTQVTNDAIKEWAELGSE